MDFIDLKTQYQRLRPRIEARLQKVLEHAQFVLGPEVGELESVLAEYVGASHCITAASGTDTLLMALMALDIGPGHEVITSPFTFIATGEMIALAGATPVFVDIEPRTYQIDAKLIERAITPRTRAIMPVSLYGQCPDFDAINAIARAHRLPVIEDAAQSFGATYRGKRSCALSELGSTSFFPAKPLGAYGEGGALFTNDAALAKVLREIRVHGQDRRYHHPRLGLNARLHTMQAAVLLAKMEIFPDEVDARATIGARYGQLIDAVFADVDPGLRVTPAVLAPHCTSVYAQYTVQVSNRARVEQEMQARKIPTAVHYPVPLHLQPVFAGLGQGAGSFPLAEAAAARVISLPMHPYLTEADQERVITALKESVLAAA
jgi:UDP-2-acetamido-2-deoxy-ribo-hexuluronate aminotransferase